MSCWRSITVVFLTAACGRGVWSDPGLQPSNVIEPGTGLEAGDADGERTQPNDGPQGTIDVPDASSSNDASHEVADAEDGVGESGDGTAEGNGDDFRENVDDAGDASNEYAGDVGADTKDEEAPSPSVDPSKRRPSCAELSTRCGVTQNDCCTSMLVPGGSFSLGGTITTPIVPASVSDFYLDEYEVTVNRFRAFLANYDGWRAAGNPSEGAGAHPLIANSGWQAHFNIYLEQAASEAWDASANCQMRNWNGEANVPVNCVTWYEAFAFCLWDDARLPTEAEWEYATVAGNQSRIYAWGSESPLGRAVFNCTGDGVVGCSPADMLPVGSVPIGSGKWGQLDLIGSMFEWVLDRMSPYPRSCYDCATVTTGTFRVQRGSGWDINLPPSVVVRRDYIDEGAVGETTSAVRLRDLGLRCARSAPNAAVLDP